MARQYIHYRDDHFDLNKFNSVSGSDEFLNKPNGGFWASPIETNWGWRDWCKANDFHLDRLEKSFRFTLRSKANVYHIHPVSYNSVFGLPLIKEPDINSGSLYLESWCYDWEKIAKLYDAVELHHEEDHWLGRNLFRCWDCDSIVIFNPKIIREKKV